MHHVRWVIHGRYHQNLFSTRYTWTTHENALLAGNISFRRPLDAQKRSTVEIVSLVVVETAHVT